MLLTNLSVFETVLGAKCAIRVKPTGATGIADTINRFRLPS